MFKSLIFILNWKSCSFHNVLNTKCPLRQSELTGLKRVTHAIGIFTRCETAWMCFISVHSTSALGQTHFSLFPSFPYHSLLLFLYFSVSLSNTLSLFVFFCPSSYVTIHHTISSSLPSSKSLQVVYLSILVMRCLHCICDYICVCMCGQGSLRVSCDIYTIEQYSKLTTVFQ